jgi:nitroreductase
MELKEVIGRRRSIRFFKPWQPVEREKIQTVLEAARLSSRAMNADLAKAIVVRRDELSDADVDRLRTPMATAQLDLAPVWIFWFGDATAPGAGTAERMKQLVDVGALPASHGWSHAYVDEVYLPRVVAPVLDDAARLLMIMALEVGQAVAHALLAAVDEGLGTGLVSVERAQAREILGAPEGWTLMWVQLLGYPAESPDAGGQRPRPPFEEAYFEGRYGRPFPRDPGVVARLEAEGMLRLAPPAPWRAEELEALARMLGLTDELG